MGLSCPCSALDVNRSLDAIETRRTRKLQELAELSNVFRSGPALRVGGEGGGGGGCGGGGGGASTTIFGNSNFKRATVTLRDTRAHARRGRGLFEITPLCTHVCPCPFFEATAPCAAPAPPVKTGARVRRFRGCSYDQLTSVPPCPAHYSLGSAALITRTRAGSQLGEQDPSWPLLGFSDAYRGGSN